MRYIFLKKYIHKKSPINKENFLLNCPIEQLASIQIRVDDLDHLKNKPQNHLVTVHSSQLLFLRNDQKFGFKTVFNA
jgi:hypothetical protein